MANSDYFSEGKYRCNHPESDFKSNSNGPIEMKKENFVEYTHRNETSNYRYDVWNNSDNVSTSRPYSSSSSSSYSQNSSYRNPYSSTSSSQSRNYYATRNPYNTTANSKKSSGKGILIFFIILWFLPAILEIIADLLDSL